MIMILIVIVPSKLVLSYVCWAQSVDLRNPWIALRNLWIHTFTLRRNPWIAQIHRLRPTCILQRPNGPYYHMSYDTRPGLTQEWFRELSFSRLECGVHKIHISSADWWDLLLPLGPGIDTRY